MTKAITLWQPHATLTALGVKSIETRSWATSYRGPIAIHAGKRKPEHEVGDWLTECWDDGWHVFRSDLCAFEPLPLGAIVATATLEDVVPIEDWCGTDLDAPPHVCHRPGSAYALYHLPQYVDLDRSHLRDETEHDVSDQLPYGDFTPGRFAWLLEDVKPTTERCPACWGEGHVWMPSRAFATMCPACDHTGRCDPIPARGYQRLWNWEPAA